MTWAAWGGAAVALALAAPAVPCWSQTRPASLTLTPASHDFGQASINALVNKEFAVAGAAAGDSVYLTITGPDMAHFEEMDFWCKVGPSGSPCRFSVTFRPLDVGRRAATLAARDGHGNRATAALRGEGMLAACKFSVVSCNYADLYSGWFSWSGTEISVTVNVIRGEAACTGSDGGNGRTGTILGKGLIGVEFVPDPVYHLAYRIVVACPTPHWPATADEPEIPSEPAELGSSYSEESYKQPVPRTALAFYSGLERTARPARGGSVSLASYPDLAGTLTTPGDAGSSGGQVAWQLRKCRAPDPGCPP